MSSKLEKIESGDILIGETGELELSEELQDAVAGGFDPELEEGDEANTACGNEINVKCGSAMLK